MDNKKFAGILLILIPVVVWMAMYLRFDCQGGSCSLGYEWIIVGLVVIVFGLILVLNPDEDPKINELEATLSQKDNKIKELENKLKKKKR